MRLSPMTVGIKHKPLRSFKELASDLGVSMAQLRGMMRNHNAPKPAMEYESGCYYEPVEFRKWWNGVAK